MKQAVILGAGKSGVAARGLLIREGWETVLLNGDDPWQTLPTSDPLLCIVSPAIPLEHPWLTEAKACGAEIISELELGARYWRGRTLAITGSKGKSSLVKLCSDTLNAAGVSACTAGNYGTPLCERVMTIPQDGADTIAVVEVSSFQMEHTKTFSPDAAALLNLQADHLDRHGTMEVYGALKCKLFQAMHLGQVAALPVGFDDQGCIPHSVTLHRFNAELPFDITGSYFDNPVLRHAAALGVILLRTMGLQNCDIQSGLKAFQPLDHRMQYIGTIRGITCINDSKATSLSATLAALEMLPPPIRLIVGGQLKEKSVSFLKEKLAFSVKKVYLIGSSSKRLYHAWHTCVPCQCCDTMDLAVDRAFDESYAGETLLLSPGTASFDQYSSYAARGIHFTDCVHKHL